MLNDARLAEIGEAISDGTPIDWGKVGSSESDAERAILRELKVVADIVQLHRDLPRPARATREAIAESGMATGQWDEQWGHLRLLDKIGHGSFGDVYRAWDTRLDREVALKLLRQTQSQAAAGTTVIEEGRLLARVRHPNVVTVFGAERINGRIGVWMEFIQGRTLEQLIKERGVFGAREAMLIASDLCHALSAVHRAGLLHRDLKAQNVMREDGGRIVLMDFGTGREQVRTGPEPIRDFAGTPLYLAPEILHGRTATAQSDVYSLGVLLFRLVTGEYPVPGRTLRDVSAAHNRGTHVPVTDLRPDLPDAFVQVLHRALAPDPKARFETAGAMEQALSRALAREMPGPEPVVLRDEPPAVLTPASVPQPTPAPPGRRFLRWGLAAALALVAGVGAWLLLGPGDSGIRRIGVLPFVNQTQNSRLTTDGIAEVLSANLNGLAWLDVEPTTTMRLYKDARKPVREIANELGVDYVVEGVLTGAEDSVRLIVNLIRSSDARTVLSRPFEPQPNLGLLAFQTEVARAIAAAIAVELTPASMDLQTLQVPADVAALPVAQQSYRLGLSRMNGDYQVDKEAAVRLLEDAVMQDPGYAEAYAALGEAHIRLSVVSTMKPRPESIRLAKAHAEKALLLSPRLPFAHVVLARARVYFDWDWTGAEDQYRRALQIDSKHLQANSGYAMLLAALRRFDDALVHMQRARVAAPADPERSTSVAGIHYYARRYDMALAESQAALSMKPDHVTGWFVSGLAYAAQGRYELAIESLERSVAESREVSRLADLARVYALAGRQSDARRTMEEMSEARRNMSRLSPDKFAFVYAALGEMDQAFTNLHQAVDEHANNLAWLNVDARWDLMRNDPRFAAIVARMGLNR